MIIAVVVPGDHLLVRAGQQPEGQSVVRILVASDDGQLQLVQLDDQPPLGRLGLGELRQTDGVGIVGPFGRQYTRRAEQPGVVDRHQPIAFGDLKIGAQLILGGVHEAGVLAGVILGDHQQCHLLEMKTPARCRNSGRWSSRTPGAGRSWDS